MSKAAVIDEKDQRPQGVLEVDVELVENIAALLEVGQRGMVLNLVADLYPADLAMLLSHLPHERAHVLFRWLPRRQAAEVLAELDDAIRAELLREEQLDHVARLLDALDTDDAADVLADLPDDMALRVLPALEDSEDVQELLGYDEETAGGIMAAEYVAVPSTMSVADVTEAVRQNAEVVEELFAIFVIDEDGTLEGIVPLKRLLLSPANAGITDVADTDFVSVVTNVDQEEVARIMQRYDLVSLPVVDRQGRLAGRITIDDVVDVIRDEAEEDIQLMSGMAGTEEPTDTVLRITRGRLPWLLVGLIGASLSGAVIGSFEEALQQAVVLATFIPVVMAMAGNAGIQSSAIVVQGIASGEVWSSDMISRLWKELAVALINGIVLAVVMSIAIVLLSGFMGGDVRTARLAMTAGFSLLLVIILAAFIGTTIPLLLHRFGVDPALATGPFIMTSNDILGLAIFFMLASLLYL